MPYAGQTLTCRVRATDPVTTKIITDATGTAFFFAPPKNPSVNTGDRTPDHTFSLTYDATSRYYLVSFSTVGWAAGTWWVQPVLVGGANNYDAWTYISFSLTA